MNCPRLVLDALCLRQLLAACLLATLLLGCRQEGAAVGRRTLGGTAIARVGTDTVTKPMVLAAAETQGEPFDQALSHITSDLLLGQHAEEVLSGSRVGAVKRAHLARAMLQHLERKNEAMQLDAGARTKLLAKLWVDVNRPELFRTVHAVVILPEQVTAAADQAARHLAETIREAVQPAANADEFRKLANDVPASGQTVRVEALPPVTADGRVPDLTRPAILSVFESTERNQATFDAAFAAGAAAIGHVGSTSPVVKSRFGYHVIRLEEHIPPHVLSKQEQEAVLARAHVMQRVAQQVTSLHQAAVKDGRVHVERAVAELTRPLEKEL